MENNKLNKNEVNIQKPISLIINEERTKLVNVINEINLHPSLLEMVLKEIYLEVQNRAMLISAQERQEYEKSSNNE